MRGDLRGILGQVIAGLDQSTPSVSATAGAASSAKLSHSATLHGVIGTVELGYRDAVGLTARPPGRLKFAGLAAVWTDDDVARCDPVSLL